MEYDYSKPCKACGSGFHGCNPCCGHNNSPSYSCGQVFPTKIPDYTKQCETCGNLYRIEQLACPNCERNKRALSAKANSLLALARNSARHPYRIISDLLVWPTIATDEQVKARLSGLAGEAFARPCPLSPLHGFVDSRSVKSWEDFTNVAREIREYIAEPVIEWVKSGNIQIKTKRPKNEVLEIALMPKVNADYNAIVTPSRITIGRGHDGATGGKNSVTIFTGEESIIPYIIPEKTARDFTAEGQQTFVEIVGNKSAAYVVQVRSGHEPKGANVDFIPYDLKAERIHVTDENTDLLAWQALAGTFRKGDVIYAASLSCHGAVHGVANGVPVITSHKPEIGELLRQGATSKPDYERVKTLLEYLIAQSEKLESHRVLYGWKLLHLLPYNLQAGNEVVIAFALFYLLLGGIAGCLGEYRHKRGKGRVKGFPQAGTAGREQIFEQVFGNKRLGFDLIYRVWSSFYREDHWPSSSFGGKKWADCTTQTIGLQRKLALFIRKPNEKRLAACITQGNVLAHCQHNGGLLFDKFGASEINIGDLAARGEVVNRLMEMLDYQLPQANLPMEKELRIVDLIPMDTLRAMQKPTPKIVKFFTGELKGKELENWNTMQASKLKAKIELQKKKQAEQEKKYAEQQKQLAIAKRKAKKEKEKFFKTLDSLKYQFRLLQDKTQCDFYTCRLQVFGKDAVLPLLVNLATEGYALSQTARMLQEIDITIPASLDVAGEAFNSFSGAGTNAMYAPLSYVSHIILGGTEGNTKAKVTLQTASGLTFESEVN